MVKESHANRISVVRTDWSVLLFINLSVAMCNAHQIDSVKRLANTHTSQDRWSELYYLASEYFRTDNHAKAYQCITQAQEFALRSGDSLRIVISGRMKAQILRGMNHMVAAIAESERVLAIAKRNQYHTEYGYLLNGMVTASMEIGSYDRCLTWSYECLDHRERSGTPDDIAVILAQMGDLYFELSNFTKALEYFRRSLKFDDNNVRRAHSLVYIGLCHIYRGNYVKGEELINYGLSDRGLSRNSNSLLAAQYGLGCVYMALYGYEPARKYFLASYRLASATGNRRFQLLNLTRLASIENSLRRPLIALDFLERAESIAADPSHIKEKADSYKEYSLAYASLNNCKLTAHFQARYIDLLDALKSNEMANNLMAAETEYQHRADKSAISFGRSTSNLKEEALLQQRLLMTLGILLAILCFGLAASFGILHRKEKNMNRLLEHRVEERTIALEKSIATRRKSQEELDILFQMIATDMRSSVSTMRGIFRLSGLQESATSELQYVKEFEETATRITEIIKRFQGLNLPEIRPK